MANIFSVLLDSVARAAGPWAAGRLKLRSNQLGGKKNAATVAIINSITQPIVTTVVDAEAAKLDAQGQTAIARDKTASEVGQVLSEAVTVTASDSTDISDVTDTSANPAVLK